MASDPEERRIDTVAVSRKALQFISTLAVAACVGISGALYGINNSVVRLTEQVKYLSQFGPGTGKRFTWDDGQEVKADMKLLRQEIQAQRADVNSHKNQGAHNVADSRIRRLEQEVDDCCKHRLFNNGVIK